MAGSLAWRATRWEPAAGRPEYQGGTEKVAARHLHHRQPRDTKCWQSRTRLQQDFELRRSVAQVGYRSIPYRCRRGARIKVWPKELPAIDRAHCP